MDISMLEHNIDIFYRESLGTDDRNLTPRMTLENMDYEVLHAKKIYDADISYPIEIYYFNNQWIILDGVHRFAKQIMNGTKTIRVRRIRDEMLPLVQKTHQEFLKWQ
jgi:hypothetical protein